MADFFQNFFIFLNYFFHFFQQKIFVSRSLLVDIRLLTYEFSSSERQLSTGERARQYRHHSTKIQQNEGPKTGHFRWENPHEKPSNLWKRLQSFRKRYIMIARAINWQFESIECVWIEQKEILKTDLIVVGCKRRKQSIVESTIFVEQSSIADSAPCIRTMRTVKIKQLRWWLLR